MQTHLLGFQSFTVRSCRGTESVYTERTGASATGKLETGRADKQTESLWPLGAKNLLAMPGS